jgi:Ribosomal protein L3
MAKSTCHCHMLAMSLLRVYLLFNLVHLVFTGSIKRWGMARGNMTHGSKSKRQHGSIGMCATPARVFPGLKMAGHMGSVRRKCRKLKVGTACRTATYAPLHMPLAGWYCDVWRGHVKLCVLTVEQGVYVIMEVVWWMCSKVRDRTAGCCNR